MANQILNGTLRVLDQTITSPNFLKVPWFKKLDFTAIASQYSTPLYITNQAQIQRNLKEFETLLGENSNVYFPVKASPCLATFKLLAEQGCGADCASNREIQLARFSGIPASRLSYYSPAPNINLAATLLHDGGNVVIDSLSKLRLLEQHLGEVPFRGKLFLRINPSLYSSYSVEADYQKHTSHGSLTSQFGLPSEDVIHFLTSTKLPFSGLHVHVGTQMDNVQVFLESLEILHELCDLIHALTNHQIDTLNLGGGLGIASHKGESFPAISELVDSLKPHLRQEFTYKMEPGNALFGDATILLAQVITRKSTRGKGWAIVNVGSDQLLKVTLAGFQQEVLRVDGTPLPRTGIDSIAGPLCFAGDILLPETDLTGIEEGDLILLPNTGAYCRAIGNRFNGHSEPGTLLVNDSQVIGLAYEKEDSYWEPIIQSFQPKYLKNASVSTENLSDQHMENIRSVYLSKQCSSDSYSFHDVTRIAPGHYEMNVDVESLVSFISAPLVMRIISDAAVAATVDNLGHKEKNLSVWSSRITVSLNGILRSKRRHRLSLQLSPMLSSSQSQMRELILHWQLGEGNCYGNGLMIF